MWIFSLHFNKTVCLSTIMKLRSWRKKIQRNCWNTFSFVGNTISYDVLTKTLQSRQNVHEEHVRMLIVVISIDCKTILNSRTIHNAVRSTRRPMWTINDVLDCTNCMGIVCLWNAPQINGGVCEEHFVVFWIREWTSIDCIVVMLERVCGLRMQSM